jgi:hypothetical protein
MNPKLIILLFCIIILKSSYSQTIVFPLPIGQLVPEHGFLPGKKFQIFKTLDKYDFKGKKLKVEIYDDRTRLNIQKINCSEVILNNSSELASPQTIFKLKQYTDSIFHQSGIIIDSTSKDKVEIRLEAIDARLIGYGYIKCHGLCQIRFIYHNFNKVYCDDIVDGDKHSPIGSKSFVTRMTATRYMASASIRECIEGFLIDLKNQ